MKISQLFTRKGVPLWRDIVVLKWLAQIFSAILVVGFILFFLNNVIKAAETRGLGLGFGFLDGASGFPIAESVIPFDPSRSFGYALWVGFLNTLKVSLVGIILASILGLILALSRLSSNWLVRSIASTYINVIRNIPLLVQLFIWYFAIFQQLPPVSESITFPGPIYLSQRGMYSVGVKATETTLVWGLILIGGFLLAGIAYRRLLSYQVRTGVTTYPFISAIVIAFVIPTIGWFLVGMPPLEKSVPVLGRFNYQGGMQLTPEYAALLAGLVVYTSAFIAEVMRGGILSVQKGQIEAAKAQGLSQVQTLRLITLPLALRVIIPPLINQYLNLTKNSSLAIAIGYVDLFFVGRTIINQAGQAVPVFLLIMATYLSLSLLTSFILNIYNRKVQLVER